MVRQFRWTVAAIVVWLGAAVVPLADGWAQQGPMPVGAPIQLLPGTRTPASEEPPAGAAGSAAAPAAPAESETAPPQGIAVGELGTLDPSSVGVLDASNGGFGPDLWRGSERAVIEGLIPRLPVATGSRAVQSLTRRLLLTAARVPQGEAVAPSFLGLRAARLAAAGDYASAAALAELAPPQIDDPLLLEIRVDAALLAGDNNGACAIVADAIAAGLRTPFWIRRLSFCRVLAGDLEAARLTASILRELPGETDAAYHTLIDALTGSPSGNLESLPDPTPLHLAMISAAKGTIPDDAVLSDDPAVLRAIATSANASAEARLRAAEAAERAGVLEPESVAQIYASFIFSDQERANALSIAADLPAPRANALLFQVALTEDIAISRAEALSAALSTRDGRDAGSAARVNADTIAMLDPSPDLAWFARDAGLALLAAGSTGAARRWFDMARGVVSESEPQAALAVLHLWPLLQVAQGPRELPWMPETLTEWWAGIQDLPDGEPYRFAGAFLAALDGLGMTVPDAAWNALLAGPLATSRSERPSVAVVRTLRDAAGDGRQGETVLLALIALGPEGPANADARTLGEAVAALAAAGLEQDARAVALEGLLARTR